MNMGFVAKFETCRVMECRRLSVSSRRICVSVTARMLTECADTVSLMHGPLFLTDQQFTAPKEIGPGLSEISPQGNNRVARP